MKKFLIAAATASTLLTLPAVHAATASPAPSVKVHFSYADLLHDAGDAALYEQLQRAARTVCRRAEPHDSGLPHSNAREVALECMQKAFLNSVATINHPTFTAYVAARTPTTDSSHIVANR
jgi:UrcA family protein